MRLVENWFGIPYKSLLYMYKASGEEVDWCFLKRCLLEHSTLTHTHPSGFHPCWRSESQHWDEQHKQTSRPWQKSRNAQCVEYNSPCSQSNLTMQFQVLLLDWVICRHHRQTHWYCLIFRLFSCWTQWWTKTSLDTGYADHYLRSTRTCTVSKHEPKKHHEWRRFLSSKIPQLLVMDRKRTRVWFDVSLSLLSKNPAKRPKPKMPVQRRSSKNRDTKAANKYHKYIINHK